MSGHAEPSVTIHAIDAVELFELLGFIADWCSQFPDDVSGELARFVGTGYDAGELRADAMRLARQIEKVIW